MNTNTKLKVNKTYPWVICFALALSSYLSIGTVSTSFSNNLPYLIEQLGLTNAQSSMLLSIKTAAQVITMFLCIPLLRRISARILISVGLIITAIGCFVFAVAGSYSTCVIAAFLLGVSYGWSGMTTLATVARNWFFKHRALSIGILTAATGVAGTINPQIILYLINTGGIKLNFNVTGIVFIVIAVLIFILVRDQPSEKGMFPLGGETAAAETDDGGVEFAEESKYAPTMVCHILMFLFIICLGGFNYAAWSHFALLYSAAGWEAADVANLMSIASFILIITKMGFGVISDKFSAQKTAWIFFGCCFISMLMCWKLAGVHSYALQTLNFVIYGIGGVLGTTGISTYAIDMSNRETYKTVNSIYVPAYSLGGMIISPFMGKIADATGGYGPGYGILAIMCILGYVFTMIAYKIAADNRKKLATGLR